MARFSNIGARHRTAFVATLTLAAAWAFLFVDTATVPLVLWDESRVAINALEMHLRGFGLVTTYEFRPDLWNTKPPLAIWLIVASFELFGVSEFSLRLPSMLAAVATLALVFRFTRQTTRSDVAAALAVALTALSACYFGPNGVKTAEYDALTCLFTTGYLMVLHDALHRTRARSRQLVVACVLIALAALTKGVAGLMPGIGLVAYLLAVGRIDRPLRDARYLMVGFVALLPVALFVAAREAMANGYVAAMMYNDVAGRFGEALDGHKGPLNHYLTILIRHWLFVAGPLIVLVPAALLFARGRRRFRLMFALCCSAAPLIVLSVAETKLVHYMIPVIPWLAIAIAVGLHVAWSRFTDRSVVVRTVFVSVAAFALITGARLSVDYRYDGLMERQFHPASGYGALLAELRERRVSSVTIVEPGIEASDFTGYAPRLHFYSMLAATEGLPATRALSLDQAKAGSVASCEPSVARVLIGNGGTAARYRGCAFLLRRS